MFAQVVRDRERKTLYDTTTFDRIFVLFLLFPSYTFFEGNHESPGKMKTFSSCNYNKVRVGKLKSTRNNWAKSTDGGILFTQDRPTKKGVR